MWPFTPGWNSKNPQKRMKAVAKISDQTKLLKIVYESDYQDARIGAVAKISDPARLLEIVYKSRATQKEAISRISDTATLLGVFKDFSTGWRAKTQGITFIPFLLNQIQNQEALAQIVSTCSKQEWQTQAASKITDPEIARRVVNQVSDWKARVRLYTISGNEQKAHYETAIHAEDEEALEALDRIVDEEDEEILYSIAINGHNDNVKDKAAGKISNQDILAKIALASGGTLAVSRITDQRILIGLLESDKFIRTYSIHHHVIRQLHKVNKSLVTEMAAQNEDSELKRLAIQCLENAKAFRTREMGLGPKLLEACKTNPDLDLVKGLLDEGIDVNFPEEIEDDALGKAWGSISSRLKVSSVYYAALKGNQALADMLTAHGADASGCQIEREEWRDTGSIHDWGEHVVYYEAITMDKLKKFAADHGVTLGSA
ncbi:MAG: hypothetical protein LBM00_00080 [Deltaproteobacteria bacterium]|jgi:hypothetical protein|nr:hypothetical protein [Deltaproteobacteria bacterium]